MAFDQEDPWAEYKNNFTPVTEQDYSSLLGPSTPSDQGTLIGTLNDDGSYVPAGGSGGYQAPAIGSQSGYLDAAITKASTLAEGYASERKSLLSQINDANKISDGTVSGALGSTILPALTAFLVGGSASQALGGAALGTSSYFNNLEADEKKKLTSLGEQLKFNDTLLTGAQGKTEGLEAAKAQFMDTLNTKYLTGEVPGTEAFSAKEAAKTQSAIDTLTARQALIGSTGGGAASNRPLSDAELANLNGELVSQGKQALPPGTTIAQARLQSGLISQGNVQNRFDTTRSDALNSSQNFGFLTPVDPDVKVTALQQKDLNNVGKTLAPTLRVSYELQDSIDKGGTLSMSQLDDQRRLVAGWIQQLRQFYGQSSRQTQQAMNLDTDELGAKILDGSLGGTVDVIAQNLRGVDLGGLVKSGRQLLMNTANGIATNSNFMIDPESLATINPTDAAIIGRAAKEAGIMTFAQKNNGPVGSPTPTSTPGANPKLQALADAIRASALKGQ